jgi:predicted DsbA family dithiol-disulfide isomerase
MNDLTHSTAWGPIGCNIDANLPSVLDVKKYPSLVVEIVSDVICPWCYVAKRNFERAVAALPDGVKASVHWLPFELNPDMPVEGADRHAYRSAKFGSWERSQKLDVDVSQAAAQAGLRMHHDLMKRTPNTFKAHRLIWLAQSEGVQDAIVEALFRAYFTEGRDVGEVDILIDIAVKAGIARDRATAFFAGTEGVTQVSESALSARQSGTSGVPTFRVNGQIAFSGAQHSELMLAHLLSAVSA